MQYLPNGNYWIGYGAYPLFTEFSKDGEVISQFQTSPGSEVATYRTYKFNYTINPSTKPDVVVQENSVYMSWNGATEIVWWNVLTGFEPDKLNLIGRKVRKTGFETRFTFPWEHDSQAVANFTMVEALDAEGKVLKSSEVVRATGSTDESEFAQRLFEVGAGIWRNFD